MIRRQVEADIARGFRLASGWVLNDNASKRGSAMYAKQTLILALGLIATSALAHTQLSSSVPAQDTVVTAAPEELVLTFSTDVRITALTLTDAAAVSYDLGTLPMTAQQEFSIPVPALAEGYFTFAWRAVGADTHVVSGEINFSVGTS
jgi:methionine-rich copper-binding protein CopC